MRNDPVRSPGKMRGDPVGGQKSIIDFRKQKCMRHNPVRRPARARNGKPAPAPPTPSQADTSQSAKLAACQKGRGVGNKRECSPGVCAGPAERALNEPRKDPRTSPLGGSPGGSPCPPPGGCPGGLPWGSPGAVPGGLLGGFPESPGGSPGGTPGGHRDRGHGPKQTRNRHIFHDKNPFTLCATEPMRHRGGGAMLTFGTELLVYPMRDPMRRKEYVREIPPG
jgi:hypothetical protein